MNLDLKRNNSGAYSPFTLRLPRFEYVAPAYAEVEILTTDCCEEYPYDRRLRSPFCPEPKPLENITTFNFTFNATF